MNTQFQEKRAIFGIVSLFVFCASVVVLFLFPPEFRDYGNVWGLVIASNICILNSICATVGLLRGEHPRWPAIVGLIFSGVVAVPAIYMDFHFVFN
jgi:hypothetical protein